MPSRPTERVRVWVMRAAEVVLVAIVIGIGLTHGVLYVEGGSMEPALLPGDLIVYRRTRIDLARGDLVVFEHAGGLVVHRVAGLLRGGRLRTRGDANESLDSVPVEQDDVRGEVLLVIPAGRAAERLAALGH